jgi:hypothetical protein
MRRNIFIFLVVIVVLVALVKDQIIKSIVISQAKEIMGVKVDVGTLGIGLIRQEIRIKELKVYNPDGFPAGVMVDIPEISVDYDLAAFLKGSLHLPLVVVQLKEMVVVRNEQGKLNVDALNVAQKGKKDKPQEKKEEKQLGMQMDVVTLNLGKVVVKDYSKDPNQPTIQAYDLGVNKTFKNVKSAEQFATLVLVEAMGPTALKNAAIYAAASALGVAFLPAGIAGAILGKDSSSADFDVNIDKAYSSALDVLKKAGQVIEENKETMKIKGKVSGANVDVDVIKRDRNKTTIQVTARKFMLPKPDIAEGVMYQITEALK